ncbi:hypothetical protein ACUW6B_002256 [Staphylococcus hominis]
MFKKNKKNKKNIKNEEVNKVLVFNSVAHLENYLENATYTLKEYFGAPWLPASSALNEQRVRVALVFMVLTGFDFVIASYDDDTKEYIKKIESDVESLKFNNTLKGSNKNE